MTDTSLATRLRDALIATGCLVKDGKILSSPLYATKGRVGMCVYVRCANLYQFNGDGPEMYLGGEFDQSKSAIYFYGDRQVRFRARKAEPDGFSDARIKEIAEAVSRRLDSEIAAHSANVELAAKRLEVEAIVKRLREDVAVSVTSEVRSGGFVDLKLGLTEAEFRMVAAELPGFLKEVLS